MNNAIAYSKEWFVKYQKKKIKNFFLIKNNKKLNYKYLKRNKIKYIFFPHWSYRIPKLIYQNFECIVFHTGNLPNHRGGSPIQNLILKGYKKSYVNAIKVEKNIDSGPIYIKKKINLDGNLEKIFFEISKKIILMIKQITSKKIKPKKQSGKIGHLKRLNENQSLIGKEIKSISKFYDKIRMLDSEEYPTAYLIYNDFNLFFKNAKKTNNKIITTCIIKKIKK